MKNSSKYSIITLLDTTKKIITFIREVKDSGRQLLRFVADIEAQLPLLVEIVESIRNGRIFINRSRADNNDQKIARAIAGCTRQIKELETLLHQVVPIPSDSKFARTQKIWLRIRSDKEISAIQRDLEVYKTLFSLKFLSQQRFQQESVTKKYGKFKC